MLCELMGIHLLNMYNISLSPIQNTSPELPLFFSARAKLTCMHIFIKLDHTLKKCNCPGGRCLAKSHFCQLRHIPKPIIYFNGEKKISLYIAKLSDLSCVRYNQSFYTLRGLRHAQGCNGYFQPYGWQITPLIMIYLATWVLSFHPNSHFVWLSCCPLLITLYIVCMQHTSVFLDPCHSLNVYNHPHGAFSLHLLFGLEFQSDQATGTFAVMLTNENLFSVRVSPTKLSGPFAENLSVHFIVFVHSLLFWSPFSAVKVHGNVTLI